MNLGRRLLNTGYVAARAGVERWIPYWPLERIERLQRFRVRSIVRHAYESVPFYRDAMRERGLSPEDFRSAADLARLPLIDGLTVREDPERFASTRCDDRSRLTVYTSGSTLHVQKKIYWNHAALLARLALSERDRAVLNALLGKGWGQRQLFIFPLESMAVKLRDFWNRATLTPSGVAERHVLSPELPFDEAARTIDTLRPQVVFSYGSYADMFFRWLSDRRLALAAPRVWVYGADMLSDGAREIIERQYGSVVWSTYQAGETGRIGFQCEERRGFHLNVDTIAVRIVDDEGRPVAPGGLGEVVISNLYDRATVLLNYRMGDLGRLATAPCSCGRSLPLLETLEGRQSDVVRLADGREFSPAGIAAAFIREMHSAIQSQMIVEPGGGIRWQIVPCREVDRDQLRDALLRQSAAVFGPRVPAVVEFVAHIPSARSGKFRSVVNAADGAPGGRAGPGG